MPVFPRHFSVPRNGQLIAVTIHNSDELRKLRTELELLRRVNRQMLLRTMKSGQAPSGKYTGVDNIELRHILCDASHPLVHEAITQIDRDFVGIRKDIIMAVVNDEANNLFYEAIESGATKKANDTTTPSVADPAAIDENSAPVTPDTAINDELIQATAELAEVVGLDLASAEAITVAIEEECHNVATNGINNLETESIGEDASASVPNSNDSTVEIVTCKTEGPCAPAVLSDATSGDAGMIIEVVAPAMPNETASLESDHSIDTKSDCQQRDLTEHEDQDLIDNADQDGECAITECEFAVADCEVSEEEVEHNTRISSVEAMPDECDESPADMNQDDNSTTSDQPNAEFKHTGEQASIDMVSTSEHPQDEPVRIDSSIEIEDNITAEDSPNLAEISNECDTVESAVYTPEAAQETLDVLQQGLRKLTNILSTEVSEDWHRASDAMAEILEKRERVESAVKDAESLVADLKSLKSEAIAARDAIVTALEDVRNRCDRATQAEQCTEDNTNGDEVSTEPTP